MIEGSLLSFYISRHNGRCTPEITMVLLRTEDSDLLPRDAICRWVGVSSRSDVEQRLPLQKSNSPRRTQLAEEKSFERIK